MSEELENRTSEVVNESRRSFLGAAAMTMTAAHFGFAAIAEAQSVAPTGGPKPGRRTSASFGPLKSIDAGPLNVGYAEAGPANGPAVILLHGWPYDIQSFAEVTPLLASAGHRVIVPYLRGFGTTRFLSSATVRNAQQAAVGLDTTALMDALKIDT